MKNTPDIELEKLYELINSEKDTYGGMILTTSKNNKGFLEFSFTKSPLIYFIDSLNDNIMYIYSKN